MTKIVLATGGFDPLHSGHISYFQDASQLGDRLVVGLNSDAWLSRKKGRAFMPIQERIAIISNLSMVSEALSFNDDTNNSVDCIRILLEENPNDEIIFANGGDRDHTNVPEQDAYADNPRVKFVFGVGGQNKQNSSRCHTNKKTQHNGYRNPIPFFKLHFTCFRERPRIARINTKNTGL